VHFPAVQRNNFKRALIIEISFHYSDSVTLNHGRSQVYAALQKLVTLNSCFCACAV